MRPPLTVSAGVLLLDPDGDVLLGHTTNSAHWDIPKGHIEPGEDAQRAAVRETFEETGIRLLPDRLHDLGRFAYRPGKDLHLFAARVDRIDPAHCVCSSYFLDGQGKARPEFDAFRWVAWTRIDHAVGPSLAAVLAKVDPDAAMRNAGSASPPEPSQAGPD